MAWAACAAAITCAGVFPLNSGSQMGEPVKKNIYFFPQVLCYVTKQEEIFDNDVNPSLQEVIQNFSPQQCKKLCLTEHFLSWHCYNFNCREIVCGSALLYFKGRFIKEVGLQNQYPVDNYRQAKTKLKITCIITNAISVSHSALQRSNVELPYFWLQYSIYFLL